MAQRRYRKSAPWGGRVREMSGRRIDRDTRTRAEIAAQVAEDDRLYAESMAARERDQSPTSDDEDGLPF